MFDIVDEIKATALQILGSAPNALTAKCRIKGLPGPSSVRGGIGGMVVDMLAPTRGIHFDIPGDVMVSFEGERRTASFVIAREHDDPNPVHVYLVYPQPL